MTREETKKILAIIDATYPNFKTDDPLSTLEAWHFFLADHDYQTISVALKTFVNTSGKGFPPSVDNLIALTRKPAELTQMSAQEAWQIVRRMISRGNYYAEKDFESIESEEIKRAIGSPAQLRIWASDPDFNDGVESSTFRKRYEAEVKRSQEISCMPKEARAMLESCQQLALEGGKQ